MVLKCSFRSENPAKLLGVPWNCSAGPANFVLQMSQASTLCFVSKPAFPSCLKDALPIHDKSNVTYNFECQCGSRYIGKTIQRLEARIKQHIPVYVLEPSKNAKKRTKKQQKKENDQKDEEEEEERKAPDSATVEHLVANVGCLNAYDRKQFTVLTVAQTQSKPDTIEALLIKKFKPDLCKQNNLSVVYTFSSHTFHTCTHMHTSSKRTSHSHSHSFCHPSHTHTSTNPYSTIHNSQQS